MKTIIGILGIAFVPLAIIAVAFRASCSFVNRWAVKGLEGLDD
tara:strand:- start:682 stop:810 length:129 start_codon:yes stop_codon:yes gene_type:complete